MTLQIISFIIAHLIFDGIYQGICIITLSGSPYTRITLAQIYHHYLYY